MSNPLVVARLLSDGTTDASFGTAGFVTETSAIADGEFVANQIDVSPAGEILLAGSHPSGNENLLVRRLSDSGSTDLSYGVGGLSSTFLRAGHSVLVEDLRVVTAVPHGSEPHSSAATSNVEGSDALRAVDLVG